MFRSAIAEGLIRHNPTAGVRLPSRPAIDDLEDEDVRVFDRDQLRQFLDLIHPRYRLLFRFLAETGMRASEALGVQWRHLSLDGSRPQVRVRRAWVRVLACPKDTPRAAQHRAQPRPRGRIAAAAHRLAILG